MVETERLLIIPLGYEDLTKYTRDLFADGFRAVNFPANRVADIEQVFLPRIACKKTNPLFVTLWAIVLKSQKIAVGDLFFKGGPDEKGEVEIGYGCYEGFERKGYMTEAIAGMMNWVANQETIRTVIAETERENAASLRVLEKNGFAVVKTIGDLFLLKKQCR